MLTVAYDGNWRAVEREAMEIARNARNPRVGDRAKSRADNTLGLGALQVHNFARAVDLFQSGVHADPSDIEVANNYGYALALAGRRAEAQEILTGVLLRDPTRDVAWTALVEARGEDDYEGLAGLKIALHYAANRSRTLAKFRMVAQTYPDEHLRKVMERLLRGADQVPTLPEGDH
jgi:predicted Zn-dependent protease